jgi:hypothetical protein
MNRIAFCQACQLDEHGAKTRIAIPHTCEKKESEDILSGDSLRKEPITKFIRLGIPQTVGELRKMLEQYPDHTSFGFRNQPLQILYFVEYPGLKCVCFQEPPITDRHG